MEVKSIDVADARLGRLLDWLAGGYADRCVELVGADGDVEAMLVGEETGRLAVALARRLTERRPPFTQPELDRWLDSALAGWTAADFLDDPADPPGPVDNAKAVP